MKIEVMHIGMKVRHPQYGVGIVKALSERAAEVRFEDVARTIDPDLSGTTPAEPQAGVSGLEMPLKQFVEMTVENALDQLGLERPDAVIEQLGARWHKGKMVLHPADPTLTTKEVPLEVFFHKVVGVRNQLRVLEQKINGHPTLSDGEKIEMQQYITRSYGSLTTFNVLFKNKQDQFKGAE